MTKKMLRVNLAKLETEGSVLRLLDKLSDLINEYGADGLSYGVEGCANYGDAWAEFVIYHTREETDEEYNLRLAYEAAKVKRQEEREKEELQRLMVKFKTPNV
jgi:hypothetical protein